MCHATPQSQHFVLTLTSQFTAKQLNRQSVKAGKDEQTEKAKLKKVGGYTYRYWAGDTLS
jgi:hypothetical protein